MSPVSIPLFKQSAMDGYAFKFEKINGFLSIVDEIPAGNTQVVSITKCEVVRIFAESKVPDSCNTAVMQELIELIDGKMKV